MNKIVAKIFRIDSANHNNVTTNFFITELMSFHNSDRTNNQYQQIDCKTESNRFELSLYVHIPRSQRPTWYPLLFEISGNNSEVKRIESKYPSFILFFHTQDEIFVIAGGRGYKVVESVLDSQFGFKVVERLIDTSKDDIRGLSQRVFLGVELASNRFFKADYVFTDEDPFGKYYKGLDVFIDNDKLKSIGVITEKKKLLIRGELGFKIDTKISFDELLNRILSISNLLKKPSPIELNPFKKLTRWELNKNITNEKTLEDILDQQLINSYYIEFQMSDPRQIYHPSLMEYLHCSTIYARLGRMEATIDTSQPITSKLILGRLGFDIENLHFPSFLKLVKDIDVWIIDEETSKKTYQTKLYEWFFGEVSYDGQNYMKFENEWFDYSIKFSEDLNNRLDALFNRIDIYEMNKWGPEISGEDDYNHQYSNEKNSIVGDKVLLNGVELADVIKWTENELVIIHVKDGFDRDLRVLQSQMINSAKAISELRTNLNKGDMKKYHSGLFNENTKYGIQIPDLNTFKEILSKAKIKFVFAFATRTKSIEKEVLLKEIKTSKSAVAKIALLHTYYSIREMEYDFSISKIIKETS